MSAANSNATPFPHLSPSLAKTRRKSRSGHSRTYIGRGEKRRNFVTFRGCWPRKTRETPYSKKVARDSCLVGAHPPVLLVFPLCLVFPPVDRHSRLDLSHYYTRFSYYTRHPFYFEANVEKKFACRYNTRLPFYSPSLSFDHAASNPSARSSRSRASVITRCARLSLRYREMKSQ